MAESLPLEREIVCPVLTQDCKFFLLKRGKLKGAFGRMKIKAMAPFVGCWMHVNDTLIKRRLAENHSTNIR